MTQPPTRPVPRRTSRARRRPGPAAAALAVVTVLAACGGGDDPAAGPTPSATPSASPSASASPTAPPSPTYEPASGETIETSMFEVTVPKGWDVETVSGEFLIHAFDLLPDDNIFVGITPNWGEGGLGEAARLTSENISSERRLPRVEDAELDGEPAFHLSGPRDDRSYGDYYGVVRDGKLVVLSFDVHSDRATREEIIGSVLPTFRWR